jgi:hypothetical protein
MRIWPWNELARLRRELRAAKLSCSAEAKKVNRLAARITQLDRAIEKHRAQERHDQAYIDLLEPRLKAGFISEARATLAAQSASSRQSAEGEAD